MTRMTFAWIGLVFSLGCSDATTAADGDEMALRTDEKVTLDGAERAEWQKTTGSSVATLRVVDGKARVKALLTKLEKTEDRPGCDATRRATRYGMRLGGVQERHLPPDTSEAIVFLDDDGERVAKLTLYPCERTLVTLKRASGGPIERYRMENGFRSAFTGEE